MPKGWQRIKVSAIDINIILSLLAVLVGLVSTVVMSGDKYRIESNKKTHQFPLDYSIEIFSFIFITSCFRLSLSLSHLTVLSSHQHVACRWFSMCQIQIPIYCVALFSFLRCVRDDEYQREREKTPIEHSTSFPNPQAYLIEYNKMEWRQMKCAVRNRPIESTWAERRNKRHCT